MSSTHTAILFACCVGSGHDGGMEICAQAQFAAGPETVYQMLTDHGYLEEVCIAGHAVTYEVQVNDNRTVSRRGLPAPDLLRAFTGPTLTIIEDITWGSAADDGSRRGDLRLTVEGQPAKMLGTVDLSPTSTGAQISVHGDLKVAIPLVGKSIEKSAAPSVLSGIAVQERVGREWLGRLN